MHVGFRVMNRTLIVRLEGEIDHHSAEYIRKKIDNEIIAAMPRLVVFDFSKVGFMDSSGIGVVMGRYRNVKRLNGNIVIAGANRYIKRVFEMAGISGIISMYDNVEKAVNSI